MVLVCRICVSADETDKAVWESTNGTDRTNHHLAKTLISLLQNYVYRFLSMPPREDHLQLLPRTQLSLTIFLKHPMCIVNPSNFQYKLMNPLLQFQVPSPLWNYRGMSATFYSFHFLELQHEKCLSIPTIDVIWVIILLLKSLIFFLRELPSFETPKFGKFGRGWEVFHLF